MDTTREAHCAIHPVLSPAKRGAVVVASSRVFAENVSIASELASGPC